MLHFRTLAAAAMLALSSAVLAAPLGAQRAVDVSITVRAEGGGGPVQGAQVEVMGTRRIGTAGADGVARMRIPPGPAVFEVRKLGYRTEHFTLNLPATDTLGIDVDLVVAPVALRGLEATATPTERALRDAGFYDRQRMGIGVFLTGRDIVRHPAAPLVDAFRRVPGVRVVRVLPSMGLRAGSRSASDIDQQYAVASTRGAGSRACVMDVYIDDMNADGSLLSQIPASDVVAIEVYRGPSEMPGKYRKTSNRCGAVVIWTRQGRTS
ncbi:MAG TPA: carboxypeptidase-like regulatory domain-containing protein [Longimicrobium sp.]|nr:carboxypeptidase-like regulatory domain-containing protein [Longimicrobium sp.]